MNAQKKQTSGIGKGSPGPGRKKGVPNKVTADLRNMIHEALANAGGVDYLTTQAKANPGAFMTLVGKTLPKEVTGPNGDPLFTGIKFIGVAVE
jgi:hypothetical protein